jgi:hypothetical protein
MGIQMVQGGALLRREAGVLFSTRAGTLGPFDSVVVARAEPRLEGDERRESADLEDGLVRGLTDTAVAVVGVQESDADPSQVAWYRERGLTSVDNVDTVQGQAALVFALGGATGSFGAGPAAEALLPGAESVAPAP